MPTNLTDGPCVEVDGVTIRYQVRGEGRPIVFVHGVWVGGSIWAATAHHLPGYKCILPTWPLGAHADPAPSADLSALATARRIPALLEALDLTDVTLVGNDTGGGLCLAALASGHPGLERIGRLVLTNCDSYEHFPPKGFDVMVKAVRVVPPLGRLLLRAFASSRGRALFLKAVCTHPPTGSAAREIFEAFATSKAARRDALTVMRSLQPSVTLDAVPALRAFTKPVLLAWGDSDKLFPLEHGRRLAEDFPNGRLLPMVGSAAFVMLDQPRELAEAIAEFTQEG